MTGGMPRPWSFDRDAFAFDFAPFGSDRGALFDLVRAEVDDALLSEIAAADYGDRADEHFAAVAAMRTTGDVSRDLDWVPGEVMQLISYHRPDDPTYMPQATHGAAGHRMRLFCVTALLRNGGEGGSFWTGSDGHALAAFESSLRLGPPYIDAAVAFFAWLGNQFEPGDDSRTMAAFALVALWPYSSIAGRTHQAMKRLAERLYGPPAPSGLDWFVDRCFDRPRWEDLLSAAADEARSLADARIIPRKCANRYARLVERVRTAEDPFPQYRERHVRFGRRSESDEDF
ncbi:MAG TPA: hypothetical protein VGN57_19700 [Pirellulaceae bacterium]|nr:hypothetical protein [Pirellulaceae bacterium]